jgi:hypothetical protein
MANILRIGLLVWLGMALGPTAPAQESSRLGLPPDLAAYRQWAQILKSPYEVPMEFWAVCSQDPLS